MVCSDRPFFQCSYLTKLERVVHRLRLSRHQVRPSSFLFFFSLVDGHAKPQHLRLYHVFSRVVLEGIKGGESVIKLFRYHRGCKSLISLRRMLLIVASVQFGLATGHVITLVVQLVRGFGDIGDPSNGPPLYLVNQATPEHVAQEVLYITNVRLISSGILNIMY